MSSSRKRRLAQSDDFIFCGVRQGDIREAARKSAQEAMAYARTRKGAARDADYQSKAAFLGASDRAWQLLVAWMDGRPYAKVEARPKRPTPHVVWRVLRKLWILRGDTQRLSVTVPLAAQLYKSICTWMEQVDTPTKET